MVTRKLWTLPKDRKDARNHPKVRRSSKLQKCNSLKWTLVRGTCWARRKRSPFRAPPKMLSTKSITWSKHKSSRCRKPEANNWYLLTTKVLSSRSQAQRHWGSSLRCNPLVLHRQMSRKAKRNWLGILRNWRWKSFLSTNSSLKILSWQTSLRRTLKY